MIELIKITDKDGQKVVDARVLWEFLEVSEQFSKWIDRMLDYGFENNSDFTLMFDGYRKDVILTIDTAKEISMLQRTPKGKQARRYFIERDKQTRMPTTLDGWRDVYVARVAEVEQLKIELDRSQDYASVKKMQIQGWLHGLSPRNIWRPLKDYSLLHDINMPYIADVNYEQVRTYHKDAWVAVYGVTPNVKQTEVPSLASLKMKISG